MKNKRLSMLSAGLVLAGMLTPAALAAESSAGTTSASEIAQTTSGSSPDRSPAPSSGEGAALDQLESSAGTEAQRASEGYSPPPTAAQSIAGKLEAGLVSAADPRATEAGMAILKQGGSATDAAIATMLALTVVEPQSSGIGGGGFYVRGGPTNKDPLETIDGREYAPKAASPSWFLGADGQPLSYSEAIKTGLSVGVPGNLRLAQLAHNQHGKLPWAALFAPAIKLAEDGFLVTPRFHNMLGRFTDRAAMTAEARAMFYGADEKPLAVGTKVRNPALAKTLRRIAREGADSFYTGDDAAKLADMVRGATPRPDGMRAADIARYRAKQRAPVCGAYRQYQICGMGPPSSGATTVYGILRQLQRFDIAALGKDSSKFWHLFAEAQRLTYADREKYLADADFVRVPTAGLVDPLYLDQRSLMISPDKAMSSAKPGIPPGSRPIALQADGDEPEERGTSHFVVVDAAGNVVSYTSTIESAFGSGMMYGGFYLNNELTDFSRSPEIDGQPVANRVEAHKRPRSSMSPTIVYGPSGKVVMAIGAAGGGTIPVQVSKALIGVLDFGLPLEEALGLPQLYSPGDTVYIEKGSALESHADALRAMGHEVQTRTLPLKANAALALDGSWQGAADPRSEGTVLRK